MYSIQVYDDEPDFEHDWVEKIKEAAPSELYSVTGSNSPTSLRDAAQELLARRSAARADEPVSRPRESCSFDEAHILVLDYDLVHVDETAARHTGEGLARLARAFSSCDIVVVLNQFPGVQFDLSLRGHLSSHADLNLDAELLGSPRLWRDAHWQGFRPWSWQALHQAVKTQRARVRRVAETPDDGSIVDALGMSEEDVARLSDSAFGFVAPRANSPEEFCSRTFSDFLQDAEDARDVHAAARIEPGSENRFVAARIGKWLERAVLAPQDVLVDVPHLVERYPFLLGDDVSDREAWDDVVHNHARLMQEIPEECWFTPPELLSRPAVWRQRFEAHPDVSERRFNFDYSQVPALVFLEDTSRFGLLDEATEFRAGHHNPFDRRFVKLEQGLRYAPQRRLALLG